MTITQALDPQTHLGDLVAQRIGRSRVFEQFGLDYCCGGKRPLAEACAAKGVPPETVLAALAAADSAATVSDSEDWSGASASALIAHLLDTHHIFLKNELQRVGLLVDKVFHAHGANHLELADVQSTFRQLRAELEPHMMKEEMILFPWIQRLETEAGTGGGHCGSVSNPIAVMEYEHDAAGELLERLRALTRDYAPPADACNSYRAMLDGLRELEADTHLHIAKENNILFPKAMLLESGGACGVGGSCSL